VCVKFADGVPDVTGIVSAAQTRTVGKVEGVVAPSGSWRLLCLYESEMPRRGVQAGERRVELVELGRAG
jgi:hypothetical protein